MRFFSCWKFCSFKRAIMKSLECPETLIKKLLRKTTENLSSNIIQTTILEKRSLQTRNLLRFNKHMTLLRMIRKEGCMTWGELTQCLKKNRQEIQVIKDFLVEVKEDSLVKDMAE